MSGKYRTDIPVINRVHDMCVESCDPETFEVWERVKEVLYQNRRSLKHRHDGSGEDSDFCTICGLNFRNSVHGA